MSLRTQKKMCIRDSFSATVPYDMEQQKKEMKEFLDDLTTRDQRMMFAVITMVITADSKDCLLYTSNDVQKLVTNLFKSTTPKGSQSNDPFWDTAASVSYTHLALRKHLLIRKTALKIRRSSLKQRSRKSKSRLQRREN